MIDDLGEGVEHNPSNPPEQKPPPKRGKGNFRRGECRSRRGRIGQLAAKDDPIIIQRRTLAMPLWNRGVSHVEILEIVNEWLVSIGQDPIKQRTLYKDKQAIVKDWERAYDKSSATNRAAHIAALNRIKREAWEAFEGELAAGRGGSNFLNIAMRVEVQLARLDGSAARAEIQAHQDSGETLTRVYVGVDLDQV